MHPRKRDTSQMGARLGSRLAHHLSKAMADNLQRTAHTRAKIGAAAIHRFVDTIGDEFDRHGAGLVAELATHPDTPDRLRPLFRFVHTGRGEAKSWLAAAWYGSGIGTSFGSLVTNIMTPVVASLLRADPNALLPPSGAADASVRGIWTDQDAQHEAAGQGIAPGRYATLRELAFNYPGLVEILDLLRRGELTDQQARDALHRNGVHPGWWPRLLVLRWVPPSAADLADQVVRGIIEPSAAVEFAAMTGITAEDFHRMTLQAGEPPGLMQLLEAYRRGIIDRARLEHGIRQSRYRNEWVDVIEALRHQPMSAADAIQAAVQGHLSIDQAKAKAEDAGLAPADFQPIYETHGEPPGVQQMLDLLNRGEMTQAEVEQGIRESRYKNKYVKAILARRRRLIPERTVASMVADGSLSHADGHHTLRMLGYTEADATALVKHAAAHVTSSHRQLTAAQIVARYTEHLVSRADAHKALEHAGYTSELAGELLALADGRRAAQQRASATTAIRAAYVHRHLTRPQVEAELQHAGYTAAERDALTHVWDIQRQAAAPHLTPAQIAHAAKIGVFQPADAHGRLVTLGYSSADATVLLALVGVQA